MIEARPNGEQTKLDSPINSKGEDQSLTESLPDDYQQIQPEISSMPPSNISLQNNSKSFDEQEVEMIAVIIRKFGLDSIVSLSQIMKREPRDIINIWLTIDDL
jgi:hypothetical protein